MTQHMPIYMGNQAVGAFLDFCRQDDWKKFILVADHNTYGALGQRVHTALQQEGWDVQLANLNPEGLHTDSEAIARVFAIYDGQPRLFVAVGSGTITDITCFNSHRSQNPFVSLPTAASVDAYTSHNSAVTIGELKGSIYCRAPIAIFTDLPTITSSPKHLTASGFADLISKFTSSADWKFTHLIWGVRFDPEIYSRALGTAQKVAKVVNGITDDDPASMAVLMEAQFESGFCMADFGDSSPASGGEHHIAHIWEMMHHWEGREGLMHGEAVGVATLMEAGWYQRFRALSKEEARQLLNRARVPTREEQEAAIRREVPIIAEELIAGHPIYMHLADPQVLARISQRILERWDELQAVAALVPEPEELRSWLVQVGAPVDYKELHLSQEQVRTGTEFGHYLRERFSINNIRRLFGW